MMNRYAIKPTTILAGIVLTAALTGPAMAQDTASPSLLPGGASSLTETHGDWTIRCQVVTQEETSERLCVMGQRQTNAQGQQVLAIELLSSPQGLEGALVLPFGLAVTQGVTVTIDAAEPLTSAFSTCIPAGCIVPIQAGSDMLEAMLGGSVMTVSTQTVEGQPLELSVSLAGFAEATNRIEDLNQ
jgi:invasion protein IalB